MSKIYHIVIGCVAILLLNNMCKTPEKIVVTEVTIEQEKPPMPTMHLYEKQVQYMPDSISTITLSLVGDLMCHLPQTNNAEVSKGVYDFNPSFEYIKPYLQHADLTIGNLETTFAGTSKPYAGYPAFNSPDAYCVAIKNAGFDFLVTANNHSMDTQEDGLLRTIDVIKKNGLGYSGTYLNQRDRDSIRILNIKGIKLGILNYTYGTNGSYPSNLHKYMLNVIDSASITNDVKEAKQHGADIVLVFYHFGVENIVDPTPAQKSAVQYALQAGAQLVIGAHPHVIGPSELTASLNKTAFVAYSLGNFLSNQYWRYTDAGVILNLSIEKNFTHHTTSYKSANFIPTWVYRGDGTRKMHIVFPAELAEDTLKMPSFLTQTHRKKMIEAFNDTRQVLTKNNPDNQLFSIK